MAFDQTEIKQFQSAVKLAINPLEKRIEKFENKINLLPTKDEFFTAMDQYANEQQIVRTEQAAMQLQIDRIKHL